MERVRPYNATATTTVGVAMHDPGTAGTRHRLEVWRLPG
jgi:hypothetical protein